MPSIPEHVVVRGNDRQDIFRSEGDRIYFHRCLLESVRRYGVSVHAYVFMTNHVHLLASGTAPYAISRAIQMLGRRYVSYFNYLHKRTGTLWEGRFKSSAVESDRYLFACYRYIELNPVRAHLVDRPAEHLWSSHRANAGGRADDLVTAHPMFVALSPDENRRMANYRAMFDHPLDSSTLEAIRNASRKGIALGSKEFCQELEGRAGRRVSPARKGRPPKQKEAAGQASQAELI